jgi:hypothetical protein
MTPEDVGGADIKSKVPIGPWPKDRKLKEIGIFHQEHMVACVEPFTLGLFTRVLGWSHDKTQVMMEGVKDDFRKRKGCLYTASHFVYGRKPATKV